MTAILRDFRVALRQWRRQPGFALTIVFTLSMAIAAVTATFAVAWAVLWRPLPVPDPDRLVWIQAQSRDEAGQSSPGAFSAYEEDARTLSAVAAVRPVSGVVADEHGTDRLRGALVSGGLTDLLVLRPGAGRTFASTDHEPGAARTLLISHALWITRYAGDRSVIGRSITLNGGDATIIGVLPRSASTLVADAEWWSPLSLTAKDRANFGPRYLDIVGRVADSASPEHVRAELASIGRTLQLKQDDGSPLDVAVTPLMRHLTGGYAPSLELLLAAVLALVLIAATNVAVLMVTRWQERSAEFAVRTSIGASRSQLLRQLLVEAGTLTAVACAVGVVLAMWLTDLLRLVLPPDIPRLDDAQVDLVAAGFAAVVAATVTLLVGVGPAIRGTALSLQEALRQGATGVIGGDRLRGVFVAVQVAVAVMMTVAAVLLSQSARALATAPRGYDARGVYTTSVTLPFASYRDGAAIAAVVDRIIADISTIPGAVAATASSQLPFAGGSAGADLALQEEAFTEGVDRQVRVRLVAPGYLKTLGGRLREGREISANEGASTPPVVIVNSTLARRLTPNGSPLGRAVKFNVPVFNGADGKKVWTIVGVADDSWDQGPREVVEPEVMLPLAQTPSEVFFWISRELHLAVRTTGSPAVLAGSIRSAITRIDPAIPMTAGRTLEERIAEAFATERLIAVMLSGLGFAGVALAFLGLGAVINHHVRSQRRNIAIRVALGASHHGIVRAFVRRGAAMAAGGAVVGAALSLGLEPLVASLLFGIEARDPRTLISVVLAVIVIATAAAWLPARRASRIDPVITLRP
jgi:putative ABC transport system permease protein